MKQSMATSYQQLYSHLTIILYQYLCYSLPLKSIYW